MLMAQIRYWSICSSRAKRNQSTPTYSIKLSNIISSLLLLLKSKFPIWKKPQRLNRINTRPWRKIRVVHSMNWHVSQKLLRSLKHYCIFHITQSSSFTEVTMLQSLQALLFFLYTKLSICKLKLFTMINKAALIEVFLGKSC